MLHFSSLNDDNNLGNFLKNVVLLLLYYSGKSHSMVKESLWKFYQSILITCFGTKKITMET